jgi:hypothetical protein
MPILDYIRIVGISDISSGGNEPSDVTFNIEYSGDADFSVPKMGIITIRLTELIDTRGLGIEEIKKIASRLIRQVLVRERDKDGSINILHLLGLPLDEWLRMNVPFLRQ